MNEMSELSKEIAAELNEEEIKVALSDESVSPEIALLAAPPACVAVNRSVPFCAAVNLPGKFAPATTPIVPRIIYDLSCLKCIVEKCTTNVTVNGTTCPVTLFNVKVVGCIPFIVNIPVLFAPGVGGTCVVPYSATPSERTVSACANGSVCLDNVICTRCNEADAIAACDSLRFNCDTVTVPIATFTATRDNCVVKVTGSFSLPNCPVI
ncbi:hypothetical protein [Clostridium sp.]|uniref:hypothetical protein n=1 Tax=Clostridium sp. TaxID=1506 RepID=UPI00260CDFAD|nr:hypothetical protein [Clostridium sp.]